MTEPDPALLFFISLAFCVAIAILFRIVTSPEAPPMPCPTCTHTMKNLGIDDAQRKVFWCSRCGSLKVEHANSFTETEWPALVQRVRNLINDVATNKIGTVPELESQFVRRGLKDAVWTPEER